jgi:hypothetical protein
MIYSPAFDALPESIRTRIYERISHRASPAVLEILRDTKADFAYR